MKAGRVDCGLRIHSETHPVENAQTRSRNNRGPAGRTSYEAEFAVAHEQGGHHRAERAMAGSDSVGFGLDEAKEGVRDTGLRGEIIHFVVEEKTRGGSDVRAVAVVEGVGAGDGVAGVIDDGKMRGVRAFVQTDGLRGYFTRSRNAADVRCSRFYLFAGRSVLGIDGRGKFFGIAIAREALDRHFGEIGV